MTGDTDVFSQADALMRRHRSFIARGGESELTAQTSVGDCGDDSDIPVLTDVVALAAEAAPLSRLRPMLESELERWLSEALPPFLLHRIEMLGEQLLADLGAEARSSLLPSLLETLARERDKA